MSTNEEKVSAKNHLGKKGLRTGYTTGACAAAATKLALCSLLKNTNCKAVTIRLPRGGCAKFNAAWVKVGKKRATAAVIKDAGDDPDVTDGAEICSTVNLLESQKGIIIDGGNGVGRVTKPGLGLEIGKAAINPVPMKMIREAITDVTGDDCKNIGISIVISVTNGEQISRRTDNPRLGILGGISILGTSGIVFPYSTSSFAASIRQSIDVSIAMNSTTVVLTTGGRSEDFVHQLFGDRIPDHSYIQVGDFIGYALKQCTLKRVSTAYVGGFIGKLTKMAMGVRQTHVKGSHVDMEFMAGLAFNCGSSNGINSEIRQANTARHVSEIIKKYQIDGFYDSICKEAFNQLSKYCQDKLAIFMIMFDFDGNTIGEYPKISIPP